MCPTRSGTRTVRVQIPRRFGAGGVFTAYRVGAMVSLGVAAAASGALVLARVQAVHLPGCGGGGGCDAAQSSVWATIPGLEVPLSHVGAAYFATLFLLWITVVRGRASRALRWLARLGAAVSVALLVVLATAPYWCHYCALTHVANLAFVVCVERAASSRHRPAERRDLGLALVGTACLIAALGVFDGRVRAQAEATAVRDAAASTQRIIHAPADTRLELVGRHRTGPSDASARLIVFFDYQCHACADVEVEVQTALVQSPGVSVSFKHFPYHPACNRAAEIDAHPNACWAARAAEAAGRLHGAAGFAAMHEWLFDRAGGFEREDLRRRLEDWGWSVGDFEREMQSEAVARAIESDVEDGIRIGVTQTPAVYINGVELQGATAPGQIAIAVAAVLAATDGRPGAAEPDLAVLAEEKLVADWKAAPRRDVTVGHPGRSMGPDEAPVHVVAWFDYRSPKAVDVDVQIQRAMQSSPGSIRYSVLHFPLEADCNPTQQTLHVGSCAMARFAESAARHGDPDAFAFVHHWLLRNIGRHTADNLEALIDQAALDRTAMARAVRAPETAVAIEADIAEAHRLGITGVPMVVINGRRVPNFALDGETRLDVVLDAALRDVP